MHSSKKYCNFAGNYTYFSHPDAKTQIFDFMRDIVELIEVDNDAPYSYWVSVEVTEKQEMIVELEYQNFENHAHDYRQQAIVDSENTAIISNHLQVQLSDLTEYLHDKYYHSIYYNEGEDAENLFADLLDLILDCGAKYKLK